MYGTLSVFFAVLVLWEPLSHAGHCEKDIEFSVNPAIASIYCAVESGTYKVVIPEAVRSSCLLGSKPNMCSVMIDTPANGALPTSAPPPAAKNKVYQKYAETAERAVPPSWFRSSYAHPALFLSTPDEQPTVHLTPRVLRYKKLRNLYQCVTRQVFIRQAFNATGSATGLYQPKRHIVDVRERTPAKCVLMGNAAVEAFLDRWRRDKADGGLFGGRRDAAGAWVPAATDDVTDTPEGLGLDMSDMSLYQLSTEVLNVFMASPVAGIWQGCFRIQGSPDCRAVLAAACLVNAAHLLPSLTASKNAQSPKPLAPGQLVSGYVMASLGRHLLHGATSGTAVPVSGAGADEMPLGLHLADFVVLQQAYLRLYTQSLGRQYREQLAKRVPLSLPLFSHEAPFGKGYYPSEALARGKAWPAMLLEGKVLLEPVYSSLRNWMFSEAQNLIDFGPYIPLPANAAVRRALTSPVTGDASSRRRILVDVGANGFFASPKYLLDSYEPFLPFTDAIMVEPEEHFKAEIPDSYKERYNITHLQMYAEVNTGGPNDMLALLPSLVTPRDFVVLKFDVDPNRFAQGPTMEWGFLYNLCNNPEVAHLVDELYIELHFHFPQLQWKHYHSNWEALDAIRYLRSKGVVVHAWP